jgi:hypothetical protein
MRAWQFSRFGKAHGGWWRPTAVVGLGLSTVLMLLYFTPGTCSSFAVNIALVAGNAFMDWPAKTTVGA